MTHKGGPQEHQDSPQGTTEEKETDKWQGAGWAKGATLMQNLSSPHGQAPWVVEGSRPPENWPQKGEVEFRNYSVRYRLGLELVLKDLSLHVRGGEKVCVGWVCAWKGPYSLWGVWVSGRAGAPAGCSLGLSGGVLPVSLLTPQPLPDEPLPTPSRWGSWAALELANHP